MATTRKKKTNDENEMKDNENRCVFVQKRGGREIDRSPGWVPLGIVSCTLPWIRMERQEKTRDHNDKTRQEMTMTRQDTIRYDKTKTRQDKNKTTQDNTRQDKTNVYIDESTSIKFKAVVM
jgi:hypothetical protein